MSNFPSRKAAQNATVGTPLTHVEPMDLAVVLVQRKTNADVCTCGAALDAFPLFRCGFRPVFLAVADEMFYAAQCANAFRATFAIVGEKFKRLAAAYALRQTELLGNIALRSIGFEEFHDVVGT